MEIVAAAADVESSLRNRNRPLARCRRNWHVGLLFCVNSLDLTNFSSVDSTVLILTKLRYPRYTSRVSSNSQPTMSQRKTTFGFRLFSGTGLGAILDRPRKKSNRSNHLEGKCLKGLAAQPLSLKHRVGPGD
jgi:hypothetical protein